MQQQYDRIPRTPEESAVASGLLVIRVVTGLVFFMHGWQKLFEHGIGETQRNFAAMGVPLPDATAVIVTFIELIGGVLLITGLLTRLVGLLLLIEMAAAIFVVNIEHGFFVANNGIELALMLGGATLAIIIAGPGAYAIDALLGVPGLTNRRGTLGQTNQPDTRP